MGRPFREKIDRLVRQCRLSNEAAGEAVGVSRETVRLWRKGLAEPSRPELLALARHFAVPVAYLADDQFDDPEAARIPERGPRREAIDQLIESMGEPRALIVLAEEMARGPGPSADNRKHG